MTTRFCPAMGAALGAAALAAASLAPGAAGASLRTGSWHLDGVQHLCLTADGTWYGEDFAGWTGVYKPGPSGQTVMFGNYGAGAGNDSMVVAHGVVQWTEWSDSLSTESFLRGPFTFVSANCSPPATSVRPGHKNPMD